MTVHIKRYVFWVELSVNASRVVAKNLPFLWPHILTGSETMEHRHYFESSSSLDSSSDSSSSLDSCLSSESSRRSGMESSSMPVMIAKNAHPSICLHGCFCHATRAIQVAKLQDPPQCTIQPSNCTVDAEGIRIREWHVRWR